MARPKIDDARDKMYRVRVNDEEEQMLQYVCDRKELKNKSDVFRAALKEAYGMLRMREFDMNENQDSYYEEYAEGISLERIVDCPYCSSKNKIDLVDECDESSYERQMGPETIYKFDTEDNYCKNCGRQFRVSGYISEYPMGAFNFEEINVDLIEYKGNVR